MTQSSERKLVAITGGIGSGKSSLINIFLELGYPVISCDEISHEVYKENAVKKQLQKHFPTAVKGVFFKKFDRKEIGKIAFSDAEKYAILKKIVTDRIFDKVVEKAKNLNGLVFVEVPLLFEGGYQEHFDEVIVLLRDKSARVKAVMERSNLTENEVAQRMSKQIDYDGQSFDGHVLINNDGDLQKLKAQALTALELIKSK